MKKLIILLSILFIFSCGKRRIVERVEYDNFCSKHFMKFTYYEGRILNTPSGSTRIYLGDIQFDKKRAQIYNWTNQ